MSKCTQLQLQTFLNAPIERCFDLARSIDFHLQSAEATGERAVAGVTTGLISEGQEVEWRAKHLGIWLNMRVRITGYNPPYYFQDSMIAGPFRFFCHDHRFENAGPGTLMTDQLSFSTPLPLFGNFLDRLLVRNHLARFINKRNLLLKLAAESELWHQYLLTPNQ